MDGIKRLLAVAAIALPLAAGTAVAQQLSGYDIVKMSNDQDAATTSSYTATMTITSKKGQQRVREVLMRSKDYGDTAKSVIVFTTPKDVAGVGYLMFDYDEKPDGTKPDGESWLYMPAMKKVRRIAGSDKGGDFMGTDFTYEDIGERGLTKDTYTRLSDEAVEGIDCYKIEAVAKDKTEKNPRRILWISKETLLLVKCEFYDRQNMKQRELTCSGFQKISGYWTTTRMFMQNVQTGTSTLLEMKNVTYDTPLDDSLFTVAALERGSIR